MDVHGGNTVARSRWKILGQGPDSGLVLAVDFSNTGRLLAGFNDLVPRLDPPVTVWETLPPAAGQVAATDYVDWWLAEVRQSGRPVRAVLGYCAGAVLAARLAERVATWQDEPLLILLDPELPNTLGLYRDFHTVGDSMTAVLSEAELREFHEAGQRVQDKFGDDDIAAVGSALGEVFATAMATAADRLGLDDEIRDELAGVFDSLVAYLVAATRYDPRQVWARSTAICAVEPDTGAPGGHAPGRAPVRHEITLEVNHRDLLRHDPTAGAVSDLLAGRTVR
jgi:hypothetical protein